MSEPTISAFPYNPNNVAPAVFAACKWISSQKSLLANVSQTYAPHNASSTLVMPTKGRSQLDQYYNVLDLRSRLKEFAGYSHYLVLYISIKH